MNGTLMPTGDFYDIAIQHIDELQREAERGRDYRRSAADAK